MTTTESLLSHRRAEILRTAHEWGARIERFSALGRLDTGRVFSPGAGWLQSESA
jgi:hypothetical protein